MPVLSHGAPTGLHKLLGSKLTDYNENIDEIVRWQLTGILHKQAPRTAKHPPQPTCYKCFDQWHGLPVGKCSGSFDTPTAVQKPTITDSK